MLHYADMKENPTIGLALGAGGARGLAHIPVFELFHIRMNVRGVGILQFGKADEIFRKAASGVRRLRRALEEAFSRDRSSDNAAYVSSTS